MLILTTNKNTAMRLLLILFCLSYSSASLCQDFSNYKRLRCQGEIPLDIIQATSSKVVSDIDSEVSNSDDYIIRREKEEFLKVSNYELDQLLASGSILFGDPVTNFVNQVADKVLADEPELRKELRFYCVKSNVTNAFATNQGMIFITLGLISQLENEAQLAYIIAHEIHHYEDKHVIDSYLEKSAVTKTMRYQSSDDKIRYLSDYSKDLEMEADSSGFFRLANTDYNIAEAYNVFDVLQFSHLPFDEVKFDYSFIESDLFVIPEKYKIDSVMPINFEDDYDDSMSSHPNVKKRRKQMGRYIVKNAKAEKNTVLSSDDFSRIRNICRFEAIRLNLRNREYIKAIYNSQIMLNKYENNPYLQISIGKALYGLAKYSNNRSYSDINKRYAKYEGEISAAYYFFEKLNREQMNVLATRYLWGLYNDYKDDKTLHSLLEECIDELYTKHELDYSDFVISSTLDSLETEVEEDIPFMSEDEELEAALKLLQQSYEESDTDEEESKYDKLHKVEKESKVITSITDPEKLDKLFHLNAFNDVQNRRGLIQVFEDLSDKRAEEEKAQQKLHEEYSKLSYTQIRELERRNAVEEYSSTEITKLVMISPKFIDYHKRHGLRIDESEEKTKDIPEYLSLACEKLGLDLVILDVKQLNATQIDVYNDIADYNDWAEENLAHLESFVDQVPILMEGENLDRLKEKYGTSYFSYHWLIHENQRKKVRHVVWRVHYGIAAFPILPAVLAWAVAPKVRSYYYSIIFDIDSEGRALMDYSQINVKANKADINSWFYGLMLDLN